MSYEQKKCGYLPCPCKAKSGDKYCGQACQEAGSKEVEIACPYGHPNCNATV